MSIAKVIEVLAEGETIEAAVQNAVRDASKTVKNIKHAYVQDIQAEVDDGRVKKFRVNTKLTFVIKDS
jgi:hypothetical protein